MAFVRTINLENILIDINDVPFLLTTIMKSVNFEIVWSVKEFIETFKINENQIMYLNHLAIELDDEKSNTHLIQSPIFFNKIDDKVEMKTNEKIISLYKENLIDFFTGKKEEHEWSKEQLKK